MWSAVSPLGPRSLFSYRLLASLCLLLSVAAASAQQQQALSLNRRGLESAARRDYLAAERDYRAAAQIYRSLGAAYQAHLSTVLLNLGEVVCGEGKLREGDGVFCESLALSRRALGAKHLHTVAALNALGHIEMMLGDLEIAEARFTEALAVSRELYPGDIQLAYALAGFSSLRLRAGKPEESLPFGEEALRISIAADPQEGLETALMYKMVGQIHRAAGRVERALPLLRKSRTIYERLGVDQDPRHAAALSEEGLALMDDGKYALAEAAMKRAMGMLEPCAGCGIELALAHNNLGLLRFNQKKYSEAETLLRKALAEEELYSPGDRTQIGTTRSALQRAQASLRSDQ